MVSDLWRMREAIDRGSIKGLYYGDFKADLVDALDRFIEMEDADEILLIEDMNATQSLQHLHDQVDALDEQIDALKTCVAGFEESFKDIEQNLATARKLSPAPAPENKD